MTLEDGFKNPYSDVHNEPLIEDSMKRIMDGWGKSTTDIDEQITNHVREQCGKIKFFMIGLMQLVKTDFVR